MLKNSNIELTQRQFIYNFLIFKYDNRLIHFNSKFNTKKSFQLRVNYYAVRLYDIRGFSNLTLHFIFACLSLWFSPKNPINISNEFVIMYMK